MIGLLYALVFSAALVVYEAFGPLLTGVWYVAACGYVAVLCWWTR